VILLRHETLFASAGAKVQCGASSDAPVFGALTLPATVRAQHRLLGGEETGLGGHSVSVCGRADQLPLHAVGGRSEGGVRVFEGAGGRVDRADASVRIHANGAGIAGGGAGECARARRVHTEVLPEMERRQVLYEWNETVVEYPREKCIHELFEEQVEKTPER